MQSPEVRKHPPCYIPRAVVAGGKVGRTRSYRALLVTARTWDVILCAMESLWRDLNRGVIKKSSTCRRD